MTRLIAWLVALSLVLGCAPAARYTAYRVPLAQSSDPEAADRCGYTCETGYHEREDYDQYILCLKSCPGVQVRAGDKCGERDLPPEAVCATRLERAGPQTGIGNAIGVLLVVAIVVGPIVLVGYGLGHLAPPT